MLTEVRNFFRFFKECMRCNLRCAMEYKKSFIIQVVFMLINNASFMVYWFVILNASGGNIKGITMNLIFYIWSVPAMAYGFAFFFLGGARMLGKYIIEGGLDIFLTQPKNVMFNVMFSNAEFGAFGDLIYGFFVGLLATRFNIAKFIALIGVSMLAGVVFACTETLVRLLAIKVGNTDYFENIYLNTLTLSCATYPEVIYSSGVKFLLYTVIPSAYVAFVPIKLLNSFRLIDVFIFALGIFAYLSVTIFFSKKMLEKYESGNNISLRG